MGIRIGLTPGAGAEPLAPELPVSPDQPSSGDPADMGVLLTAAPESAGGAGPEIVLEQGGQEMPAGSDVPDQFLREPPALHIFPSPKRIMQLLAARTDAPPRTMSFYINPRGTAE